MQRKQTEVEKLDAQCLKQICKDIERHSAKCFRETDAESSDYLNFQRMFSDRLLTVLCSVSNESCLNKNSTAFFIDCINFVFNPFLVKIYIPNAVDFSEEIASAISTNCKRLCHLILPHKVLTSDFCVNFFKVMRNLVILDLSCSSFESLKLMKAIGDSLVNLKVLDLSKTNINDHGVYILCGHECPMGLTCTFIKTCKVVCKLQLRYINLQQTTVGKMAVACLLTHVPTLTRIPAEVLLSQVIAEVSVQRENFEMSVQKFQLRTINCLRNPEELSRCLKSCPQLRELSVKYTGRFQPQMDEVLAEAELERLQFVSFGCSNLDLIFSEKLKCFWKKLGPQINFLYVYGIPLEGHIIGDLNAVCKVLTYCLKLKGLYLSRFVVRSLKVNFIGQFPRLPDVQFLVLELAGNPDLVNRVACKFIRSAPNVSQLTLKFLIRD